MKIKHNLSKHPLYVIWRGIKLRCYTKTSTGYENYGGRGVKMCDEWVHDFEAFYKWAILKGWEKGLQIDKDSVGDGKLYSPQTCIFITAKQNCNKRRGNRRLLFNGENLTISEWSDKTGIPRNAIRMRLEQYKYSIETALTKPVRGTQIIY